MPGTRYKIVKRLPSLNDDMFVDDHQGHRLYYIGRKRISVLATLVFKDVNGKGLAIIQEKLPTIHDSFNIFPNDEEPINVHKNLISGYRVRWKVKNYQGQDLMVEGDISDHKYTINHCQDQVAGISKQWFSIRDSYWVEIEVGHNALQVLAICLGIDMMMLRYK